MAQLVRYEVLMGISSPSMVVGAQDASRGFRRPVFV